MLTIPIKIRVQIRKRASTKDGCVDVCALCKAGRASLSLAGGKTSYALFCMRMSVSISNIIIIIIREARRPNKCIILYEYEYEYE